MCDATAYDRSYPPAEMACTAQKIEGRIAGEERPPVMKTAWPHCWVEGETSVAAPRNLSWRPALSKQVSQCRLRETVS